MADAKTDGVGETFLKAVQSFNVDCLWVVMDVSGWFLGNVGLRGLFDVSMAV